VPLFYAAVVGEAGELLVCAAESGGGGVRILATALCGAVDVALGSVLRSFAALRMTTLSY
jgi:hypothetical protein